MAIAGFRVRWAPTALLLACALAVSCGAGAAAETRAYVALGNSAQVAAIDIETGAIVARIAVGASPRATIASANGRFVISINEGDNTISVIDTSSNAVVTTINATDVLASIPSGPDWLREKRNRPLLGYAVPDADASTIYLAQGVFGAVAIDRKALTARPLTAPVGDGRNIAISRDGSRLLLLNHQPQALSVVDTKSMTVSGNLAGLWSQLFAFAPDGAFAVAPLSLEEIGVSRLDDFVLKKVGFRNPLRSYSGAGPHWWQDGVAISPDGARLYAAARNHRQYHIFGIELATGRAIASPAVDRGPPSGVAVTEDGRRVVAVWPGQERIAVYDAATLGEVRSIAAGPAPSAFRDFVVATGAGIGARIDRFNIDVRPRSAPRDDEQRPRENASAAGPLAYIALNSAAQVVVADLSAGKAVVRIPVGPLPRATIASADGRIVLALSDGNKTLAVIETGTNRVVETLDLGQLLAAILKDESEIGYAVPSPDGSRIYVSGKYSGVAAIDRKTRSVRTIGFGDGRAVGAYGYLALSADGKRLFAAKIPAGLGIIDTSSMSLVGLLPDLGTVPFAVSKDGRFAAAMDRAGNQMHLGSLEDFAVKVVAFDAAPRSGPGTTTLELDGIAIARDGKRLFVTRRAADGFRIFSIDVASGATIASPVIASEKLSGLALTNDDAKLVATVPSLGVVRVFDAKTLKETMSFSIGPTPMAYQDFVVER